MLLITCMLMKYLTQLREVLNRVSLRSHHLCEMQVRNLMISSNYVNKLNNSAGIK